MFIVPANTLFIPGHVLAVLVILLGLLVLFVKIRMMAAILAVFVFVAASLLLIPGQGMSAQAFFAWLKSQNVGIQTGIESPVLSTSLPEISQIAEATRPPANPSTSGPTPVSDLPKGICGNTPGNEDGDFNVTLVVEPGHLLNVEWYDASWSDHVRSILSEGTYVANENIRIGGWWDYQGCTYDQVFKQSTTDEDWSLGFTKQP